MQLTSNAAASPFSTQPSGPRPVGCFSALLARPVSIQIWALRSRLEKQPTDLRRRHYYMRDGALARKNHAFCETTRSMQARLISLPASQGLEDNLVSSGAASIPAKEIFQRKRKPLLRKKHGKS